MRKKNDIRAESVVTTEEGIVVTGDKADSLEARLIESVRKPFYLLGGLLMLMFVLMLGGAIFLNRLDDTVHNTDKIVSDATGPRAREEQAQVIQQLLDVMDCQDQRNLQELITEFVDAGFERFKGVSIIDPECVSEEGETNG